MAITTKFSTADFSQPIQFPSLRWQSVFNHPPIQL
jgi:hypothetical protein